MRTASVAHPWSRIGIALLAWTVAVTHTFGTLRVARSARSRNTARAASMIQLEQELQRLATHGALSARLTEATSEAAPFDFAAWLAKTNPTVPMPVLRLRATPSDAPWAWQSIEAEWPHLPLAAFAALVESAEALNPPVRLVAVSLDPLVDTAVAKVTAVFETATAVPNGER